MANTKILLFGTQRNLYSIGSPLGFAFGFCVGGNANFMFRVGGNANFRVSKYQHVGIPNAKLWRWGLKPTPVPSANGFASQWNIGLRQLFIASTILGKKSWSELQNRLRITESSLNSVWNPLMYMG